MKNKNSEFHVSVASLERLKQLLLELDMVFAKHTHTYQPSTDMLNVMRENNLQEMMPQSAAILREQISQIIQSCPIVKLTTSQPLEESQQQAVIDWLRSRLNPKLIVSFRAQSQILGGVIIQTPTKRYDFSLATGLAKGRKGLIAKVAA